MSNLNLKMDITLPLKNWEKYDISFDRLIAFCQEKCHELQKEANEEAKTKISSANLIAPAADMYKLCIAMLQTAKTSGAKLVSITCTKRGIVFEIVFTDPTVYKKFYTFFVHTAKKYGVYSQEKSSS